MSVLTWRRRVPAAALPFEPRERPLSWATCRSGCRLVATAHGLWEWPEGGEPVRHCWRAIDEARCTPTTLMVRSGGQSDAVCEHVFASTSDLPDLVRALVAGSRLVDLSFTLPSGNRLRIDARTCRFEGGIVWTSQLQSEDGDKGEAGADSDADLARGLMARARREYGMTEAGPSRPLSG